MAELALTVSMNGPVSKAYQMCGLHHQISRQVALNIRLQAEVLIIQRMGMASIRMQWLTSQGQMQLEDLLLQSLADPLVVQEHRTSERMEHGGRLARILMVHIFPWIILPTKENSNGT